MLTLEPGYLPVFEKLCERQKKGFICVRIFMGSLSYSEIMGFFLWEILSAKKPFG